MRVFSLIFKRKNHVGNEHISTKINTWQSNIITLNLFFSCHCEAYSPWQSRF